MYVVKNHSLLGNDYYEFADTIDLVIEEYNLDIHKFEFVISKQCKRAAGNIRVYEARSIKTSYKVRISVSYDYYKTFGLKRIILTLKHEFAHFISFLKCGKVDHGTSFKQTCLKLGGSMSSDMAGTTYSASACEEYIGRKILVTGYTYTCKCGIKINYIKRMSEKMRNSNTKRCRKCLTPLKFWVEEKIN